MTFEGARIPVRLVECGLWLTSGRCFYTKTLNPGHPLIRSTTANKEYRYASPFSGHG